MKTQVRKGAEGAEQDALPHPPHHTPFRGWVVRCGAGSASADLVLQVRKEGVEKFLQGRTA